MKEVIDIIPKLLGSFLIVLSTHYVSSKLFDSKIQLSKKSTILLLLGESFLIYELYFLTYLSVFKLVRIFANILIIGIINKMLFKQSTIKTILVGFLTFAITAVAEAICTLFVVFVTGIDVNSLKDVYFVKLTINIAIGILMIIIINVKPLLKILLKILRNLYIKRNIEVITWILVSLCSYCVLFYYMYFKTDPKTVLIISLFLIIGYSFLTIKLFQEKNENLMIQEKYDIILNNMNEYEKMLDIQRMRNHENDNNLISLKGMVSSKNREAIEFIDTMIKDKKNDDQYLILKTKNIPTGGLQGLIYQKLLTMKEKGIYYNIEVSKNIQKEIFEKENMNFVKDVCTIVGILLDNAIQEVEKYEKKLIGVYLYEDGENLYVIVSNNYKGILEIDAFDKKGYTTKGTGHGYGLSLVKEISDKEERIQNKRKIDGDIFSHILKIKVK